MYMIVAKEPATTKNPSCPGTAPRWTKTSASTENS